MSYMNPGDRFSSAGLASATSANGTARNGASLALNQVEPGTLICECVATIVTGSVVATFQPQVSTDGSTWVDLTTQTNTAITTVTATATRAIPISVQVAAYAYFRMVATLSGAATAGGDLTAVTYRWVRFGYRS